VVLWHCFIAANEVGCPFQGLLLLLLRHFFLTSRSQFHRTNPLKLASAQTLNLFKGEKKNIKIDND
jgi:hypothetical protein